MFSVTALQMQTYMACAGEMGAGYYLIANENDCQQLFESRGSDFDERGQTSVVKSGVQPEN
jgi:hypothetical protein